MPFQSVITLLSPQPTVVVERVTRFPDQLYFQNKRHLIFAEIPPRSVTPPRAPPPIQLWEDSAHTSLKSDTAPIMAYLISDFDSDDTTLHGLGICLMSIVCLLCCRSFKRVGIVTTTTVRRLACTCHGYLCLILRIGMEGDMIAYPTVAEVKEACVQKDEQIRVHVV